jgi:hypothetical protein
LISEDAVKAFFLHVGIGVLCSGVLFGHGGVRFDDYFVDATMRVDYFHSGDHSQERATVDQIYRQGVWAGNPSKLVDDLNYGLYFVKVYDVATNELIYSAGFCSLFGEYKTTGPAREGVEITYHESALIPYPKREVLFVLAKRNAQLLVEPFFSVKIDPGSVNIIKEKADDRDRVVEVVKNGDPGEKVDFVFVAEGYTGEQYDKFVEDVKRFSGVMFETEPFKSRKDEFNVSGVFRASAEGGVDEPRNGAFRNTAVSAAYNALDLSRYLLVDDNKAMRDIAGRVAYDRIIVLANTSRYGGGGIYNNYCIFTADDSRSEGIFLHEFGHAFAYIADEYYNAAVSYSDYYPAGTEPIEENITALPDAENVKWKDLLSEGIEVPTPWGQEEIAVLQEEKAAIVAKVDKKIAGLRKVRAAAEVIEEAERKLAKKKKRIDDEVREIRKKYREKYAGKIGVFEGAGYTAKGLYRSRITVGFFTNGEYNEVSQRAINRVIGHYSK